MKAYFPELCALAAVHLALRTGEQSTMDCFYARTKFITPGDTLTASLCHYTKLLVQMQLTKNTFGFVLRTLSMPRRFVVC